MSLTAAWRPRSLGTATWEPCHGWTDGVTTWVDAYLRSDGGGNGTQYLDIGCEQSDAWDTKSETADGPWQAGGVLCVRPYPHLPNVDALIVPAPALTTELIEEALRRYASTLG